MAQYEWIFVVDDLSDDAIDGVYATCDALVSHHDGFTLLTVTAEGSTAAEAAKTTITQLQHERQLVRFQRPYEDFVTKVDIAARCSTTPQAVGQWVRGKRQREFPFPGRFSLTAGGIWLWGEVNHWLRQAGKSSDDIEYPCREDYSAVNHWICEQRAIGEFAASGSGWIYPVEGAAEVDADVNHFYGDGITSPDFHLVPLPCD
ncbi:MAG: hypothetical protein ACRDSZ_04405 [Pseudonocardiaceae bacterium]